MSGFRQQLLALLARFDEDGFVALANRGLLRRAQKDLEKLPVDVAEETADALTVAVGEYRIRFDARGPAHARCSCPATGVCCRRHWACSAWPWPSLRRRPSQPTRWRRCVMNCCA